MTWILRTISWHRRKIAAILTALGMFALVSHLSGATEATTQVVLTSGSVAAGEPITDSDVALAAVPLAAVPANAVTDLSDVVGRNAAAALSARTILQPGLLVSGAPPPAGRSLVPITVRDAQLREMLAPGMRIALVSASGEVPGIVTEDAVVHTMPILVATSLVASGQAALILVDVATSLAPEVSMLGQSGQLTIFLTG
ncbi:MAG: SAF domain-containing protein [Propionibacteriaceae bacterium]|nr:SAF domain-containing protein [Propionibacteriaceae bacterium]